jgi:hypothetical protein
VRALLLLTAIVAVLAALWMALLPGHPVAAFLHVGRPLGPVVDPFEVRMFQRAQLDAFRSDSVLQQALKQPGITQLQIVREHSDPVAWLKDNLVIVYPNDSEILCVRLVDRRDREAAEVVNAVVDAYIKLQVEPATKPGQPPRVRLIEKATPRK